MPLFLFKKKVKVAQRNERKKSHLEQCRSVDRRFNRNTRHRAWTLAASAADPRSFRVGAVGRVLACRPSPER